jgi:phosphohistidine phosphatase
MGPLRLTLLRHGQAQAPEDSARDFDRPLTRRGRDDARSMGRRLAAAGWVPDLVLASPAVRTATTAQIVAGEFGIHIRHIEYPEELYAATADGLWRAICRTPHGTGHVLLCGHNPAISELASRLGPRPERRSLAPAAYASAHWRAGRWQQLEPGTADACERQEPQESVPP